MATSSASSPNSASPDAAVDHLRASDPELARLIDLIGPYSLEVKKTGSAFAALAEAVVYQQLHGKAAAAIFGRVTALAARPSRGPTPDLILGASDETLRAAGLSRAKILSLRDLAAKVTEGGVPSLAQMRRMADDEIIERLSAVRGIGRWTAEMFLIFRLGRPDVLPVDDYGLRQGFAITFGLDELPGRKEMEARGIRWRPHRTAASWYLWRALELKDRVTTAPWAGPDPVP